jgi:hypothetical protein
MTSSAARVDGHRSARKRTVPATRTANNHRVLLAGALDLDRAELLAGGVAKSVAENEVRVVPGLGLVQPRSEVAARGACGNRARGRLSVAVRVEIDLHRASVTTFLSLFCV